MKSTEEYINEVYKKYAQTQEQNIKYKVVKMRLRRPLIPLCIVVISLVMVGYLGFELRNYEVNKNPGITEYVKKEDEKIIYRDFLRTDAFLDREYLNNIIKNSTDIFLVSEHKIKEVVCEFFGEKMFLKTIGSLRVDKILKCSTDINNNVLYEKRGGIKSFKELETMPQFDWNKIDQIIANENIPEEQKSNTFYEQKPGKGTEFEDGKQYLVFLKYNEETKLYEIFDFVFGIMEYDPQTNKVKNIDTGEFEEFDWDLIK